MTRARPLRDVFTELTGDEEARRAHSADPQGYLSAQGHPDLPADLVAEAVVSFADAAPPPVAEHLAPYVMEHSSVPYGEEVGPAAEGWLDLLASAPPVDAYEEPPEDPVAWFGLDHGVVGDGGDLDSALSDSALGDSALSDFGLGDFGPGAAAGAGLAAVVFGAGSDQPGADQPAAERAGADPTATELTHAGGPSQPAGLIDPADLDDLALPDAGADPHHVSDLDDEGLDDRGLYHGDDADLPDS
ncbi:MAG: hypothetical protein ACM30G_19680 [Micromonosporaceae bacterium]